MLKRFIKGLLPPRMRQIVGKAHEDEFRYRVRATHALFRMFGLNIVRRSDYYSTLPVISDIARTRARWDRPSTLSGVSIDWQATKVRLAAMHEKWGSEFDAIALPRESYGPGFPRFDGRTLYYMLRELKPRRYVEIGSGYSTFYSSEAARRNAADGSPTSITCVEPFPYPALNSIPNLNLLEAYVQDVDEAVFDQLEPGDVLFIDSTHALKIDSDVSRLLLDVLPRLQRGTYIHIHDIPFPYNTPYPASTWLFGWRWPVYWNEAQAVQAFLAFNNAFEVYLSSSMVRHHEPDWLLATFPDLVPFAIDQEPFSSLWLHRVQ